VRLALFGGEAWTGEDIALIRRVLRPGQIVNAYGPTEAVITPTAWHGTADDAEQAPQGYVPIGRPVGRRTAHVLDANLQPLPQGVPGELYLGGEGLARGYLGRAALTAERFVADPFDAAGGRLYRTGDLVRWRGDGQLEYLGRLDHQVKVRGFRIELAEIEARLREHAAVREALVLVHDGAAGASLVAYVSPAPAAQIIADGSHVAGQVLYAAPVSTQTSEALAVVADTYAEAANLTTSSGGSSVAVSKIDV